MVLPAMPRIVGRTRMNALITMRVEDLIPEEPARAGVWKD